MMIVLKFDFHTGLMGIAPNGDSRWRRQSPASSLCSALAPWHLGTLAPAVCSLASAVFQEHMRVYKPLPAIYKTEFKCWLFLLCAPQPSVLDSYDCCNITTNENFRNVLSHSSEA